MVCIVKGVHEISVECVDILKAWKAVENCLEFLCKGLSREFDLSRVERSNSRNLEARANLCGQSSLGSTEDDVDELLRRWHGRDLAMILAI